MNISKFWRTSICQLKNEIDCPTLSNFLQESAEPFLHFQSVLLYCLHMMKHWKRTFLHRTVFTKFDIFLPDLPFLFWITYDVFKYWIQMQGFLTLPIWYYRWWTWMSNTVSDSAYAFLCPLTEVFAVLSHCASLCIECVCTLLNPIARKQGSKKFDKYCQRPLGNIHNVREYNRIGIHIAQKLCYNL